jgi:NAD(P)-dependent dehydrogenase (short-subunit alcohol dehydrogenase family)
VNTPDPYRLIGKAAIVVGSANGIGRAIALELARAGASIACVDLDETGARDSVESITASNGAAVAIRCDVSIEGQAKAAAAEVYRAFGRIDVLVNGAAIREAGGTILEYDLARWNSVYGVMVGGAFLMSKCVVPLMSKGGGGSIIHIASQLGSVAAPGHAAYCSAKGALIQLARAMAVDHAAAGIRVNSLSPGAVETGRLVHSFGSIANARRISGPKHLVGRLGLPEEIARAALFLASDASSFMTGADLLVDGGYTAT